MKAAGEQAAEQAGLNFYLEKILTRTNSSHTSNVGPAGGANTQHGGSQWIRRRRQPDTVAEGQPGASSPAAQTKHRRLHCNERELGRVKVPCGLSWSL